MNFILEIQRIIKNSGFWQSGYISVSQLKFYPEIRAICEGNTCRNYATSWACPPAIGTIAECKNRVEKYENALLFSKKYELEDSFDFETMINGLSDFKKCVDVLQENLKGVITDFLLLSNEGCGRCSKCTYPNEPCRFPNLLHHSLEGYGFIVNELAQKAGILYNNGENTVTYFGALFFNNRT